MFCLRELLAEDLTLSDSLNTTSTEVTCVSQYGIIWFVSTLTLHNIFIWCLQDQEAVFCYLPSPVATALVKNWESVELMVCVFFLFGLVKHRNLMCFRIVSPK